MIDRGPAKRRTTGIRRLETSEQADSGSSVRPATKTDSSMPVGSCTIWVTSEMPRYIAMPSTSPETFAVSTARRRTSRSSTSGRSTRSSLRVQSASRTIAASARPSVAGPSQPQSGPFSTASRSASTPPPTSTAPTTSSEPSRRAAGRGGGT